MELIPTLLRGLQLLWLLLLTALIGNVIATNISAASSAEAAVNFSMFVIVITWLAALYGLVATVVEQLSIPLAQLGLDGAAALFTFIDAIVLAAKLRAVNCANTKDLGTDWIGYGSADDQKRCRELQASTFFMWVLFATTAINLGLFAMTWRRTGGSVRSGPPHMAQVRV
ncbi:hypothetical protein GQ53DRAFT_18341 [Thozetella sp. PMI_491]|nr:hypothetical protein GQ53DRAFT_18341 [Thozetella sp. PMI_491]